MSPGQPHIPVEPAGTFEEFEPDAIEQTICRRFESRVRLFPGRPAIQDQELLVTYQELNQQANRLAWALLGKQLGRNRPVGLMLSSGTQMAAAILGILKAGHCYVPLDPGGLPERNRRIIEKSGLAAVLASDSLIARVADAGASIRVLPAEHLLEEGNPNNPEVGVQPDDPAYIFFTSGSTGEPKGVVDCHRNVLHNVRRYTNRLRIGPQDRLTLLQSPIFSGSVSSLFGALLNGACVYPLDVRRRTPGQWAEWVRRNHLTMWHSVPVLFRQLCATGQHFPSVRVVRLEGDQSGPGDVELFRSHFSSEAVLSNGLGATETGLSCCFLVNRETQIGTSLPVGYPLEDVEILLVDDRGVPVDHGEVGEIEVRSRFLATGYWNDPDLTRQKFQQVGRNSGIRLYRSGDLGRMDGFGCLDFLGRKDHQMRMGGQWVNLPEIESALARHPGVLQTVVAMRRDRRGENRLAAYFVPRGKEIPTVGSLRRHLLELVPASMTPSSFMPLAELPTNQFGKVDRAALPSPSHSRPLLDCEFRAPVTPLERSLAGVWSEILEVDQVGTEDNFFELGGDSLDVSSLLSRVDLSVDEFLRNPTVRGMSQSLEGLALLGSGEETLFFPIRQEGSLPPVYCFPSHDGSPVGFFTLARHLDPNHPVWAARFPAVTADFEPFTLEQLGRQYAAEIRRKHHEGCFLAGHCFGGVLAYSVASCLMSFGYPVHGLFLLSSPYEGLQRRSPGLRARLVLAGRRVIFHLGSCWAAGLRGVPLYLLSVGRRFTLAREEQLKRAWFQWIVARGRPIPAPLRHARFATYHCGRRGFDPTPYSGRVVLLERTSVYAGDYSRFQMGWGGLLTGDVRHVKVDDQVGGLLGEPGVRQVADVINRFVRRGKIGAGVSQSAEIDRDHPGEPVTGKNQGG